FAGYTYVWNSAQSDAELAEKPGTDIELAGGRPWRIPSRAECMMCHSREANFSLTLNEWQLNRGDQLARWEKMGMLQLDPAAFSRGRRGFGGGRFYRQEIEQRTGLKSSLLPRNPDHLGRFTPASDASASLETRARNYLAVNCAHCHTTNG